MSSDQTVQIIWGVMALTLVGSSLAARRLPFGTTIRMAAGWCGIFALVFVLFLFRGEAGEAWSRAKADILGQHATVSGKTLRIPMSDDGHFWVDAQVNGKRVEFLIDSGATTTALSSRVAQETGVEPDSPIPVVLDTANGSVDAQTAQIARLSVGSIVQTNARAVISPSLGETNMLGMSFLSSLKSWRVEGRTLILEPN